MSWPGVEHERAASVAAGLGRRLRLSGGGIAAPRHRCRAWPRARSSDAHWRDIACASALISPRLTVARATSCVLRVRRKAHHSDVPPSVARRPFRKRRSQQAHEFESERGPAVWDGRGWRRECRSRIADKAASINEPDLDPWWRRVAHHTISAGASKPQPAPLSGRAGRRRMRPARGTSAATGGVTQQAEARSVALGKATFAEPLIC